jgi:hypothetical protein
LARLVTIAAVSISSPFEAGKRHRPAGFQANEEGLPLLPLLPPFVESVGRKQAAATTHGVAERRLLQHRLSARVDQ